LKPSRKVPPHRLRREPNKCHNANLGVTRWPGHAPLRGLYAPGPGQASRGAGSVGDLLLTRLPSEGVSAAPSSRRPASGGMGHRAGAVAGHLGGPQGLTEGLAGFSLRAADTSAPDRAKTPSIAAQSRQIGPDPAQRAMCWLSGRNRRQRAARRPDTALRGHSRRMAATYDTMRRADDQDPGSAR
jgi:hypothetical protein